MLKKQKNNILVVFKAASAANNTDNSTSTIALTFYLFSAIVILTLIPTLASAIKSLYID